MAQTDCPYYYPIGGTHCGYVVPKGTICFHDKVPEGLCPYEVEDVEVENPIEIVDSKSRTLEPL